MRIVLLLTVLHTTSAALPISPHVNVAQIRMDGDGGGGSATPESVNGGSSPPQHPTCAAYKEFYTEDVHCCDKPSSHVVNPRVAGVCPSVEYIPLADVSPFHGFYGVSSAFGAGTLGLNGVMQNRLFVVAVKQCPGTTFATLLLSKAVQIEDFTIPDAVMQNPTVMKSFCLLSDLFVAEIRLGHDVDIPERISATGGVSERNIALVGERADLSANKWSLEDVQVWCAEMKVLHTAMPNYEISPIPGWGTIEEINFFQIAIHLPKITLLSNLQDMDVKCPLFNRFLLPDAPSGSVGSLQDLKDSQLFADATTNYYTIAPAILQKMSA